MNERYFVDTSAFYALSDPSSADHRRASVTAGRFTREQAQLYTTNFIVAETHTLILNRVNRGLAERVLDQIHAGSVRIIRASEGDETRARTIIHQHADKDYSMVDAISFAVMERLHIRLAWTYDQHFAQYGFALAG